ncbi:hypothetical protein [Caldalkalibacillus salinus]|uniref:hypothetical protein n=1 Tax=Caldalkalibacillus salinus TaxID=2803787 RepID=UPI001924935B|nr:hypothetical protein [Caldalkalibacillus salinus]
MSDKEQEAIVKNIEDNLAEVEKGLSQMYQALEASGFKEALPGYKKMKETLQHQRLFILTTQQKNLEQQWREVGATAKKITDILSPFTEVMADIHKLASYQPHTKKDK